jgi:hypothetical protein
MAVHEFVVLLFFNVKTVIESHMGMELRSENNACMARWFAGICRFISAGI